MKLSFNLESTKAIIIANDKYKSLPHINPAKGNFESLIATLKDKDIIGLKEDNIIALATASG